MTRILLLIILALTSVACKNKIETLTKGPDNNEKDKVEVSFSLAGEHLDISSEELMLSSKASGNDITAIQIYQRQDAAAKYKPYCYGLWDDRSNISVKLNRGYQYSFEVTILPDAKTFVALNNDGSSYRQPLMLSGTGSDARVKNEFIYHTSNYLSGLKLGSTAVKTNTSHTIFNRPVSDRYYGEKTDVNITGATSVTIETKRVVFGLKYEITGFTSGEVRVALRNAPDIILTPSTYASEQTIITMQGSTTEPGSWTGNEYKELIPFKIYWKKAGGTETEVASREHGFQRKTLYTLKLDLTAIEPVGSFNISLEEGGLINGGSI